MIIFYDKTYFLSQTGEKHPKTYGPTATAKATAFQQK